MPAFQAAPYVAEAIESVLAQEHAAFELLVMDDGSTDGTWKELQNFKKDPRVRLFRSRRNRGQGKTRNHLLRFARGVYISPCDADDIMLPGNLARLSKILDANPEVGAVYGDLLTLETHPERGLLRVPFLTGNDPASGWDLVLNQVNHAGSMIRRDLIERVGGYGQRESSVDDWSLWLKLAEITEIRYLRGEVHYVWRRHPGGASRNNPGIHREVARMRLEALRRRYPGLELKLAVE